MHKTSAHRFHGFTLVEVMIAVAIVAILTAVALPNYTAYVQRAHRSNAKAALLQTAQFMERAATANGTYPLTAAVPTSVLAVEGGRYAVTLVSADGATFTATAARVSGSGQANDACGDFRIDQAGARTILNASAGKTAADCWNR